jgi:hypothetical protein
MPSIFLESQNFCKALHLSSHKNLNTEKHPENLIKKVVVLHLFATNQNPINGNSWNDGYKNQLSISSHKCKKIVWKSLGKNWILRCYCSLGKAPCFSAAKVGSKFATELGLRSWVTGRPLSDWWTIEFCNLAGTKSLQAVAACKILRACCTMQKKYWIHRI